MRSLIPSDMQGGLGQTGHQEHDNLSPKST
jgi:hypothetical protein